MRIVDTRMGCLHDPCAHLAEPCRIASSPRLPIPKPHASQPTWSHQAGFCYVPPYEAPPPVTLGRHGGFIAKET